MLCPNCRATYSTDDLYCRNCGADLTKPSTSLVPVRRHLPAALSNIGLPRLAASVGVIAASAGLELLRRRMLARLANTPRGSTIYRGTPIDRALALPPLDRLRDLLMPQVDEKPPKDYVVQETVVYMHRVVRREK